MKKSESNQSLEEEKLLKNSQQSITNILPSITELSTIKSSSSSSTTTNYYHNKRGHSKTNKLRKSFSGVIDPSIFINDKYNNNDTDIIPTEHQSLSIKSSTTSKIEKIKSLSRFSAAFQSLRRKTKSIPIPNNNNNNTSASIAQISSLTSSSAVISKEDNNLLTNRNKDTEHKLIKVKANKKSAESLLELKKSTNFISKSSAIIESADTKSPPLDLTPTLKKKKSKLSKRFSLASIKRKNKFNSRKTKSQLESPTFTSSSTQTLENFDRRTPEGNNLTYSQQSLFESAISDIPGQNKRSIGSVSNKFEKVKKDSSKRGQPENNFLIVTLSHTSNKDYPTALTEISSEEKQEITTTTDTRDLNEKYYQQGKLNVTESTKDTPPLERAPSKPISNPNKSPDQLTDDRKISLFPITIDTTATAKSLSETEINTSRPPVSDTISAKGAIRKTTSFHPKLRRQQSREEFFDSDRLIRREGNLDRGRRIPRPPANEQSSLPDSKQPISQRQQPQKQQQQQQQSNNQQQQINNFTNIQDNYNRIITERETSIQNGNNIKNLNLSGLIAITNDKIIDQSLDRSIDDSEEQYPLTIRETKIQFSVGKAVRSSRLSSQSSTSQFILNQIQSTDSKDCCSIGSNRSSGSQSPISEGSITRRKIKYIDQKTFYTEEERDILTGKRETYSHLSGISEYSLDSEFSIDTQMPAFGDLTMDHEEAPIMTLSSVKREHLYKILVIGELGTGKTSFIKRYVHQFFSQNYRATIGVDFALKVLNWDKNTLIRLQLWDIAGQERFGNMTRVYYKEAVGAFIVFDVTRSGTFDCVSKWKEDLDSKVQLPDGSPIPCILLANKCDQDKQCTLSPEKMDEYCKEYGFSGWFETSAKDNINIEEAATALVNKILLNDKLISASDIVDSDKFALANESGTSTSQTKKSCSC